MKKLHLICNAHIDPVWQWTWDEGISSAIATFKSAADLAEEFDYIFCHNEAMLYEAIEESAPDLFKRIQDLVKQGKWKIVGGWYLQPDCNLPSGEAYARQSLYAQRYFKENLGVTAKVGYNVDSFGHNGMLPQILQKSGLKNYVFMRPGNHENEEIPDGAFDWESPDGSRVRTFRIPGSYGFCHNLDEIIAEYPKRLPEWDTMMMFYGVGNHGGGPTVENI